MAEGQALNEHVYRERVRQAEVETTQRRIARLEDRMDADRPLFKDGVVGFTAALAPMAMLASAAELEPKAKRAALAMAAVAATVAGHQWAEHRSEARRSRAEDELDRQHTRLATKLVPVPVPSQAFTPLKLGW